MVTRESNDHMNQNLTSQTKTTIQMWPFRAEEEHGNKYINVSQFNKQSEHYSNPLPCPWKKRGNLLTRQERATTQ